MKKFNVNSIYRYEKYVIRHGFGHAQLYSFTFHRHLWNDEQKFLLYSRHRIPTTTHPPNLISTTTKRMINRSTCICTFLFLQRTNNDAIPTYIFEIIVRVCYVVEILDGNSNTMCAFILTSQFHKRQWKQLFYKYFIYFVILFLCSSPYNSS